MYTTPIRSDELYHHGVLGMKWGVRRYQNKDGSLTALGKKKIYGKERKFESRENREKRSREGVRYQRDLNKNEKRLNKAIKDNDSEKIARYKEAKKILTKNKDIMLKDLSPAEIQYGKDILRLRRNVVMSAALSAIATAATGGTAGVVGYAAIAGGTASGVATTIKGGLYKRRWIDIAKEDKARKKEFKRSRKNRAYL